MQQPHGPLRSFGRIKSRVLKPNAAARMDGLLPQLTIPDGPLDPQALMPGATEVWLEIGFGGGEHLAAQAAKRPDVLVLGAEPFINGVASALGHIEAAGLSNVRLRQDDARPIIDALPDASLSRIFLMFPDPWQKARHHKRRIVQPETLAAFARVLKPGGRFRFASDWADYVDWTLERVTATPDFRWTADRADDWRIPPADHVTTRYEEKKLGDIAPVFLDFERV
ncbi:MAG: tRNA (guanosine(46)-N7)-methyltransferase TrmB [Caulobacterales bacterium 68-7]|nr:tRNA (guanosine(46)-N7)-methyltransferase TrmB [Caulobacterales bacterium]OJU07680.1 MAG: tRNA (guanosine(46)-N7)-methyltransferase TrmB [Caulobacterales bacterium 68-7]